MAALSEVRAPELIDLRDLGADDLGRILEEEKLLWRSQLYWDFCASADLVQRFVRIQALSGFALVVGGQPVGYSYFVTEDRKALIGDLYVMRDWAHPEWEDMLLGAVLEALSANPHVHRIEAQLMMLHGGFERTLPFAKYVQIHPRNLMLIDLDASASLPASRSGSRHRFTNWEEARHEDGALLIADAYEGHIDSTINDQYRTIAGAKRFLSNIVQYPGCGTFFQPASWVADHRVGPMCGLSLASLVAPDIGHITQICVSPQVKGRGVGYELLRRSLGSLARQGCDRASLTVTAANTEAVQLYQRVGFRAVRRFAAYVWDGL
jgi:ribosomal protein S18 acetylase RimI-like enzyme